MVSHSNSGKSIQSVQRAIDILNCFTSVDTALSLGDISERLALNKATVHGILNTLHNNDFVCQNNSGKYLLGRALFTKAELAPGTVLNLYIDSAKQYMQRLSNLFQANGTLFVVENNVIRMVYNTEPTNCVFVIHRASDEAPLYTMASGKLMLAFTDQKFLEGYLSRTKLVPMTSTTITSAELLRENLAEIRATRYSYEKEELFEGVSAIAVPIFSGSGKLFGTISLTGMASSIARQQTQIVLDLKRAAQNIQQTLTK